MNFFKINILILLVLLLLSCKPEPKFAVEPYLEFVSITKIDNNLPYDDLAEVLLYFQDGDGDIGLNNNDILPPFDTASFYHYNFFVDYYEKQNGEFVLVNLDITNNGRIPRLSETYPESIEGEISMQININNYFSPFDTVKFEFYIVDRALNHSNIVSTPEIVINK